MKAVLFALGLICLLPVAQAEIGGISGGGGGVTNPDPVEQYHVRQAAVDSRLLVASYLNRLENEWHVSRQDGDEKADLDFLFKRKDDAFTYLNSVQLEFMQEAPCLTDDGREVDGSVNTAKPGIICLSSFNLGKKLSSLNYEYETAALIFHELIHVMGGSEVLAVRMQKNAIYALFKTSIVDEYVSDNMAKRDLEQTLVWFNFMKNAIGSESPMSDRYGELAVDLSRIRDKFSLNRVHPLRSALREQFEGQILKLLIIGDYAKCVDASEKETNQWHCDRYKKGFGEADKIPVDDYLANQNDLEKYPDGQAIYVRKITSNEIWREEFDEIETAVQNVYAELATIADKKFPVLSK